jgi:small-conductance mechanosensitive channel
MDMNYLYAAMTILIGIIIAIVARRIVNWLKTKAGETETQLDDIVIKAIGTPVQITVIAFFIYLALTQFGILPEKYAWLLGPQYITSFWILIGAWILSSFLHDIISIYGHMVADKSEGDWDDRLVDLFVLVAKYLIWFIALILILSTFEVDITPFLAGAGIAGLAIALAAQDLVSNFFGGALITVDKPFKIGDRVKIDNYYGDIVHIGPRSTRLQTLEYQIVTIPNNKITGNIIVNYSMPDPKLKMTIPVSVAYGSDIDKVTKVLYEVVNEAIRETGFLHPDPAPQILFVEFGASDLKFIIKVWAKAYNTPDEIKDTINRRVNARFIQEGIEIPFQQIDIRMRT